MTRWLRSVAALTHSTVIALARSKIYLSLLGAGGLLVLLSMMLAELAVGEMVTSLVDVGLAFIAFIITAISIFTITGNSNSRQLIPIIARPIDRSAIIVSRYLSVVVLALTAAVLVGGILSGMVLYYGGPALRCFTAVMLVSLEGMLMASIALVFWTRLAPVGSASMAFVVFVLGRMDQSFAELLAKDTFGAATPMMKVIAHGAPKLSHFDATGWVHGGDSQQVMVPLAYCALYSAAMLLIAQHLYRSRDFT